jgi:glycosyltransferase involved in cell wall biosynthesis
VSVITPVYNGEKYLAECIESVLAQSYPHWVYTIINNRSTDGTLELARAYARRDARVSVYDNAEFLPAIDNFNHAMRQLAPASVYCKVVHADDWLFPDCLAQMVALAEAHPTIGLVSAYRLEEERVSLVGLPLSSRFLPGREVARLHLLAGKDYFGSPSSHLLRAEVVRARDPFYADRGADTDTTACLELMQGWDFGFVHQVLTFTRRHNESRSAAALRFDAPRLARIRRLLRYGPLYLSGAEHEARLRRLLRDHYAFLARSLLQLQEPAFWKYQVAEMRQLGHPLRWARLAAALPAELADVRQAVRQLRQGLASRRARAAQRAAGRAPTGRRGDAAEPGSRAAAAGDAKP